MTTLEQPIKRGRGRPRKDQAAVVVAPAEPKKRGRKPKVVSEVAVSTEPKRRGRPRKEDVAARQAEAEEKLTAGVKPSKELARSKADEVFDDDMSFDEEVEEEFDDNFDDFEETDKKSSRKASSMDDEDMGDFNVDDINDLYEDNNKDNTLADVNVEKEIVPYAERVFERRESNIDQKNYSSTSKSLHNLGIQPYVFEDGEELDYMNDKQRKHIKDIIIATRTSLLAQLEETKEEWAEEKSNYADELDLADQESDFALTLRNRDRERRLIQKLDRTLMRIDNDPDFGYCDKCGEEIGIRRLEARPTAELCINCKSKSEIHERQGRA